MATTKPHMASQREVCFPREPAQNLLAPPPNARSSAPSKSTSDS